MDTALKDSIRRIRTYKRLINEYSDEDGSYERVIKREWDKIRQVYRSDEMHPVYEVEGLHSETIIYSDLSDLTFAMSDIIQDLIGLEITIKVKEMRGTDIGRMRLIEE